MKYKLGDTLVEVTLAVGIFSMVAIAIAAVMNGSTSSAQSALEATLTREEIDTQAEALRFIQNAYLADENMDDHRFSDLWGEIVGGALTPNINEDSPYQSFIKLNPATCYKAYEQDGDNIPLSKWNAFIINPRELNNYSISPGKLSTSPPDISSVFIQVPNDSSLSDFTQAKTYPRLTFSEDQSNNNDTLIDTPSENKLHSAEGIYAVAVKGCNKDECVPDYYDFYIRACWFSPGDDIPTSISTLVRLYNPLTTLNSSTPSGGGSGGSGGSDGSGGSGDTNGPGGGSNNDSNITYKIVYNGNGATGSSTMDSAYHEITRNDDKLDHLYASNYRRDGYGFAGWSTEQIDPDAANAATLIADAASNNKIYGPNATITTDAAFIANADSNNIITLYAVWVKPENGATLQGWNGCNSMNQKEIIALKDQRDHNAYAVTKLADGKCWMIENLRLDAEATRGDDNKALAQGYAERFGGLDEPTRWDEDRSLTHSTNPLYNNENTASPIASVEKGDSEHVYSYGNYYNWYAATADTSRDSGITTLRRDTSICPNGWHLPSRDEIQALFKKLTSLNQAIRLTKVHNLKNTLKKYHGYFRSFPNNFIFSGLIGSSEICEEENQTIPQDLGCRGLYWSSAQYDRLNAFYLSMSDSYITPATRGAMNNSGLSIRCVATSK